MSLASHLEHGMVSPRGLEEIPTHDRTSPAHSRSNLGEPPDFEWDRIRLIVEPSTGRERFEAELVWGDRAVARVEASTNRIEVTPPDAPSWARRTVTESVMEWMRVQDAAALAAVRSDRTAASTPGPG